MFPERTFFTSWNRPAITTSHRHTRPTRPTLLHPARRPRLVFFPP
jgi:hypothetical protein